ncbi:MAG: penicillin-binding protein 1C [Verrucomicrobiaceae bacterium]|nr:penicillin-binding protein 1C [Verrucomicrobiaceae bacterium]
MLRRWIKRLAIPAALLAAGWWGLPWCVELPDLTPPQASPVYLARDGTPLRHLLDEDGTRKAAPVKFEDLPEVMRHAMLAAEDKRFFSHGGIDLLAIARAAWDNARAGKIVSGASTIHQQLIKNATPREGRRTLGIKLQEALQARRLAMSWSREDVLAAYLSRIPFGNNMTGITTAASGYFHKPLADLTPAECALLAALPQSPARWNPFRDVKSILPRQKAILAKMRESGWLSAEEHQTAMSQEIVIQRFSGGFAAPHVVEVVKGSESTRTTIDALLQQQVETIIAQRITALRAKNVSHAAVVVIENASGDVLALAGSRDFFAKDGGQINGAWSPRSPGSALKPFTYEIALERGASPGSIVADLPVEFTTTTGNYKPENYALRSFGPMTYRAALGNSLNISAVRVLNSIGGAETLLAKLQELGLSTLTESADHYGLGLTIGNAPVRLLELTNAYATLARLGLHKPWRLQNMPAEERRVMSEKECFLIADILSDNQAREMAFGANSPLRLPFRCAAKTGTSTSFRDNWTLGFTADFTVGVWVGNFDNTPMQDVSGVTGAGPVFRDVMLHLHEHREAKWLTQPAGIIRARIDPRTGKRLTPLTPPSRLSRDELFTESSLPPVASADDYDSRGRVILPSEYAAWAASRENWLGDLVTVAGEDARPQLRITNPVAGTVVRLDPDIPGGGSRLLLQAEGAREPRWSCPTLEIRLEGGHAIAQLKPGRHEIEVTDPATGQKQRTFVIVHPE